MFQASIGNTTIYNINININCQEKKDVYNATCIFTNRENNTRNATVKIPVIYGKFSIKHQFINKFNRAIKALVNLIVCKA